MSIYQAMFHAEMMLNWLKFWTFPIFSLTKFNFNFKIHKTMDTLINNFSTKNTSMVTVLLKFLLT